MSESKRSVFSILGSFGPGGAIAVLTEKLIRAIFTEGYDLGDESEFKSPEDAAVRKLRQDYVNEIFDFKKTFDQAEPSNHDELYAELSSLIDKYLDDIREQEG
jgi:hypothetical protein